MKSKKEIQKIYEAIASLHEQIDWRGDNFRYGFHMGKVAALGWILDEADFADVKLPYTFEDFMRERKHAVEDMSDAMRQEEEEMDNEGGAQA